MEKGKRQKGKGTRQRSKRRELTLAAALLILLVMGGSAHARQPPTPPEGFVPAGDMLAREQLPAAPFVIGAYSVAWVVVFGYLWSIWRRIGGVERDLADVSRRIAAGERR
jgi:CcmD family protein